MINTFITVPQKKTASAQRPHDHGARAPKAPAGVHESIHAESFKNPFLYLNELGSGNFSETMEDAKHDGTSDDASDAEDAEAEQGALEEARQAKALQCMGPAPHPLPQAWTFWYLKPPTGTKSNLVNYESLLHPLGTFATVEEFWSLYLRLKRPESLTNGTTDYSLFHSDIRPVWEDPSNAHGGKLILRLKVNPVVTAAIWEIMILSVIGGKEFAGLEEEVCGLVFSVRQNEEILSIWTRHANDMTKIQHIRDTLKRVLGLPGGVSLEYKPHHIPKEVRPETAAHGVPDRAATAEPVNAK